MKSEELGKLLRMAAEVEALEKSSADPSRTTSCLSLSRLETLSQAAQAEGEEKAHLASCDLCRSRLAAFRRLDAQSRRHWGRRLVLPALALAAAASLLILVFKPQPLEINHMSVHTGASPTRGAETEFSVDFDLSRIAFVRLIVIDSVAQRWLMLLDDSGRTELYLKRATLGPWKKVVAQGASPRTHAVLITSLESIDQQLVLDSISDPLVPPDRLAELPQVLDALCEDLTKRHGWTISWRSLEDE